MKNIIKEAINQRRNEIIMDMINKALRFKEFKQRQESGQTVTITNGVFKIFNEDIYPTKINETQVELTLKAIAGEVEIKIGGSKTVRKLEKHDTAQRIYVKHALRPLFAMGIEYIVVHLVNPPMGNYVHIYKVPPVY